MKDRPPGERPDEDLVREAQRDREGPSGSAAASELFGRYQERVYLWCYGYVRERERALDLAQDVMVKAWTALPSFAYRSKFSWWMFVISRNRCLNAVSAASLLRDDDVLPDALPTAEIGPAEEFEQRQDEEATRRLMARHLDDDERTALWLGCFERMPVEAITKAMGLENASGARGLLQRARRKLRAALEARAREGED